MRGFGDERNTTVSKIHKETDFEEISENRTDYHQKSNKSILDLMENHYWLKFFLIASGNHWPDLNDTIGTLCKIHFVFTRIVILAGAAMTAFVIGFIVTQSNSFLDLRAYLPIYVALLLVNVSVLPAQHLNRHKLSTPLSLEALQAVDSCLKSTFLFMAAAMVTTFAAIIVESIPAAYENAFFDLVMVIPHLYVTLVLSFNMFLFMLDVHTSTTILYHLHFLADQRTLTIQKFCWARKEIHTRVDASRLASDFIIVPCLASAVGISVTFLLMKKAVNEDDDAGNLQSTELRYIGIMLSLLKEIIYLFVSFWYVARVNEQADKLTSKLSGDLWGEYSPTGSAMSESVKIPDLHRLSIFASCQTKPITFSLVFQRVSKQNVLMSALGFGVTIVAGILKNIVDNAK